MDQADTSVRAACGNHNQQQINCSCQGSHTPVPVLQKCPFCTRQFSNLKSLMQHSVIHLVSQRNQSGECQLYFEADDNHIVQSTSHQNPTPCCQIMSTNRAQTPSQGQGTNAGNQQPHACNVAGPECAHLNLPQNQGAVQTPAQAAAQTVCVCRTGLSGNHQRVENVAMEESTSEATPACHRFEDCHQNVPNAASLQEHGSVRPVVVTATDTNRGRVTVHATTLRRLKTVHTGRKHESCLVCGFANAGVINKHNPLALKPHGCGICGLQFRLKSTLEQHQNIHSDQMPYQCNQCQKRFRLPRSLRMHMNTHPTENNFQCEECGHTFGSAGTLHQHRQSHAARRRHKCDICGLAFKKLQTYENHRKVSHPAEKPHRCDSCGKHFRNARSLGQHKEVIHGLDTPCQCSSCKPRVVPAADTKIYQCNLCQKRCTLPAYLMMHKLHVHNVVEPSTRLLQTAPSTSV